MIDFQAITDSTFNYNFHTHTQFCDGRAPMSDMVQQAVACGMKHLGFSPHSPLTFETSCNMSRADVRDYLTELEDLREQYRGRIMLYAGMEIDYVDEFGPADRYYKTLPLDYRIGSVHFIRSMVNPAEYVDIDGRFERFKAKMHQYFNDDIEAVVRSFYAQSLKMVEAGGFDIIGHFDKIGHNAALFHEGIDEEPWYDKLVLNLFEAIMDHHYIVEINTKAFARDGRLFPAMKYMGMLKRYNAPVLINSDPLLINAGREEARKLFAAF